MKKILLQIIFLLLVLLNFSKAQTSTPFNYSQSNPITVGGLFDTLFDKEGNKYDIKKLFINDSLRESFDNSNTNGNRVCKTYLSCSSGYFNLFIDSGSGFDGTIIQANIDRRNVVCQVLNDLSNFINSPLTANGTKVNIWLKDITTFNNVPSGVLGFASQLYCVPYTTSSNAAYFTEGQVQKTIISGIDAYKNVIPPLVSYSNGSNYTNGSVFFHGIMTFDPTVNWHTNLSTVTQSGEYDLYTMVLHEMFHALGFASLVNFNGISRFGSGFPYYATYDKYLYKGSSKLLTQGTCTNSGVSFNTALNPLTTLSPNATSPPCATFSNSTTCSTAISYHSIAGSYSQPVYTPNCYETGSSLSHFEDQCSATPSSYTPCNDCYFTMSNANGTGFNYMKRFPKQQERFVLCDIGYSVNTSYGNTLHPFNDTTYSGGACNGMSVIGINDGLRGTQYNLTAISNSALTFNGDSILKNDYFAANTYTTSTFECLQIVNGNGTITAPVSGNGNSSTTITYQSASTDVGLVLLSYIPVDAAGKKGNLTYIYLYFFPNTNCTTVNLCDMVNNGGFESRSSCGYGIAANCWINLFSSADLLGLNGCTTCATCASGDDNWQKNILNTNVATNTVATVFRATALPFITFEGIETTLNSPIQPNQLYTLSFYAFLDNLAGQTFNNSGFLTFEASTSTAPPQTSSPIPGLISLASNVKVPNDSKWHFYQFQVTNPSTNLLNNLIVRASTDTFTNNYAAYVMVDDISLKPANSSPVLTLADTIFCDETILANLDNFVSPYSSTAYFTIDTFTHIGGAIGTSTIGGTLQYSLVAHKASAGLHFIYYHYTDNMGCLQRITKPIYFLKNNYNITAWTNDSICKGSSVSLQLAVTPAQAITNLTWTCNNNASYVAHSSVINPVINQTSKYYLTANIGSKGCIANDSITITALQTNVSITTSPRTTICKGDTTTLTASGAITYTWTNSTNSNTNTGSILSVNPITTTTYTLIGNINGCSDTTQQIITVKPTPSVTITATDTDFCVGYKDTLIAVVTGGTSPYAYLWSPSTALTSTNTATVYSTTTATITYTVKVTGANGCFTTKNKSLIVRPLPTLTITPSPNDSICVGDTVRLNASGATNYLWTTTSSTATFSNSTATSAKFNNLSIGNNNYAVKGTNGFGCSTTIANKKIVVNPLPNAFTISYTPNPLLCSNTGTFSVSQNTYNYTWLPNISCLNTNCNTGLFTPSHSTKYYVTATNPATGCKRKDSITVILAYNFSVTINSSIVFTNDCTPTVKLTAHASPYNSAMQYSWVGSTVTDSIITIPINAVAGSMYICNVNKNGCIVSDTFIVPTNGIGNYITGTTLASTLSTTAIKNQTIYFAANAKLIIDVANFKIAKSKVYLGSNALISINANNTLTIDTSLLKANNCNTLSMWDGIHIQNATAQLILHSDTLMQAKKAVYARNGGKFTIERCLLNSNYKHIWCTQTNTPINAQLRSNIFDCTVPLIAPYSGLTKAMYAIQLDTIKYTQIGDYTNAAWMNKIGNCYTGIYARNSNVDIYNNTFSYIQGSAGLGGNGNAIYSANSAGSNTSYYCNIGTSTFAAARNYFNYCDTAVFIKDEKTAINSNRINYCYRGITLRTMNFRNANVVKNYIYMPEVGIKLMYSINNSKTSNKITIQQDTIIQNGGFCTVEAYSIHSPFEIKKPCNNKIAIWDIELKSSPHRITINQNIIQEPDKGIYLQTSSGVDITNNMITLPTNPTTFVPNGYRLSDIEGINAENSTAIVARCNSINTMSGNHAATNKRKGFYFNNTDKSNVDNNTLTLLDRAIESNNVGANSLTYTRNNMNYCKIGWLRNNGSQPGKQGMPNYFNFNTWTGVYNTSNPKVATWNTYKASNIYVPASAPNNQKINIGMDDQYVGASVNPPNQINDPWQTITTNIPYTTAPIGTCTIPNQLGTGCFNCRLGFVAPNYEYANMVAQDSVEYFDYILPKRWADRRELMEQIADSLINPYADTALFNFYIANRESAMNKLIGVERLIYDRLNNDTILTEHTLYEAKMANDAVQPENEQEVILKNVYRIWLNSFGSNTEITDQEDINQLENIAMRCPFEFGEAVFIARSLLSTTDESEYDDSIICGSNYSYRKKNETLQLKPKENNTSWQLYPNPANQILNIIGNNCNNSKIKVVNTIGAELSCNYRNITDNKTEVDVSKLPIGIYYIQLVCDKYFYGVKKFVKTE